MASTFAVHREDCLAGLPRFKAAADLLIFDSPYNFGQTYEAIDDAKPESEFESRLREWLHISSLALKPTGTMWIFAPEEMVSEVDIFCRKELGLHRRRHLVWAFSFGQAAGNNFTRSHCHMLYMTASDKNFTFNAAAIKVPSARHLVYGDKRAAAGGKLPDATWMLLHQQMAAAVGPDFDVWLQPRICGTFKERRPHSPNQIPVALMERIVLACSNSGDLVVDPFCGTASAGRAALKHGRHYVGFDLSETAVREAAAGLSLVSSE